MARERRKPALKAPERARARPARRNPRRRAPRGLDSSLAGSFQGDASTWTAAFVNPRAAASRRSSRNPRRRAEAAKARPAPKRNPNAEPPRQLTQAEILAEAAVTEVANLQDLERLLNIEEAVKKKAERVKKTCGGPSVRHHHPGGRRRANDAGDAHGRDTPRAARRAKTRNPGDGAVRHRSGGVAEIQRSPHGARATETPPPRRVCRRERIGADGSEGDDEGDDGEESTRWTMTRDWGRSGGGSGGGSGSGGARRGRVAVATTTRSFVSAASGAAAAAIAAGFPGLPSEVPSGVPSGASSVRPRGVQDEDAGAGSGRVGVVRRDRRRKGEKIRLPKRRVTRGRGAALDDGTRIDA